MKNKGKVHPSPSTPNTNTNHNHKDKDTNINSVLNLLPATILTLLSLLSLEDREVLAYLITVSLKTTRPTPSSSISSSYSSSSSKTTSNIKNSKKNLSHKESPVFDCDCFDCYTSYWTKWDSSPNRELIHQALEAFEEQHHASGFNYVEESDQYQQKQVRKNGNNGTRSGSKKKDNKAASLKLGIPETSVSARESGPSAALEMAVAVGGGGGGGRSLYDGGEVLAPVDLIEKVVDMEEVPVTEEVAVVDTSSVAEVGGSNRRGLARKVLPDVLGLLNSHLWSLWSPQV